MKILHRYLVLVLTMSLLLSGTAFMSGNTHAPASTHSICPPYDPDVPGSMQQGDCLVLLTLYNQTNGTSWIRQGGWLGPSPCTWWGIRCSWRGEGYVGGIDLRSNNLVGSLPAELGSLQYLDFLGLDHNQLSGSIPPELGHLPHLLHLWLKSNKLTGHIPRELGNITTLDTLELYDNQLTGAIPAELGNLVNLHGRLTLAQNKLEGPIPPELGNLRGVIQFDLFNNELSGAIPAELGNLTKVRGLQLNHNHLTGSIPDSLGSLTNLTSLNLNNNGLTGVIPAKLGNLENLEVLFLGDNRLQGEIPPELGDLNKLTILTMEGNKITGTIPSGLGNLANLQNLDFQWNGDLHGPLPKSFLDLNYLGRFYMNGTKLCVPSGQGFQDWLSLIPEKDGTDNVCPLPVVLVHGYNDTASSWSTYINDFLPTIGITRTRAYSVQLDMGYGDHVANSIFQNAQTLGSFIAEVKQKTGEDQVNIVAHSMGGLVARAYINYDMNSQDPDVNQLIMLGTPNGGSNSATLLELAHYHWGASSLLGKPFIEVATHELTPGYLKWFNSKVSNHKGVPFYALAGNYGGGLCIPNFFEGLANDIVVWEGSVKAIPLDGVTTYPDFHSCKGHHSRMREIGPDAGGQEIFDNFVAPLLTNRQPVSLTVSLNSARLYQGAEQYQDRSTVQFADVQTGTLHPTDHLEFTLDLSEAVTQTTFIVMGNPDQMTVSLRDPTGSIITPGTSTPEVQYLQMDYFMLMTGYTISDPAPGTWTLIVDANSQTPAEGNGLVILNAIASDLLLTVEVDGGEVTINSPATITAHVLQQGTPFTEANVTATLTAPDNTIADIQLIDDGNHGDGAPSDGVYGNVFAPTQYGTYGAVIKATGRHNGNTFNRWSATSLSAVFSVPQLTPILSISQVGDTAARLSWTSVSGAVQYNLYRDTTPHFEPVNPSYQAIDGLSFDDVGVLGTVGTEYFYVVKAIYPGGGQGEVSNRVGGFTFGLQ